MAAALAASVAAAPLDRVPRHEPSLKEVVRRMAAYADSYGEKASIFVATERYTQDVTSNDPGSVDHRVTVGDFAIVKVKSRPEWIGLRDVFEVDGVRVGDHQGRLIEVLTSASGTMDEARQLSDESARFNIGPIFRNFNVPTTALFFFTADNVDRFKFSRKGSAGDGIWEIAFRETSHPTLIRTPEGESVPTEGSVWVAAETGTVVRTDVHMRQFGPPGPANSRGTGAAEIDVTYAPIPALDMWLPATMNESYEGSRGMAWQRMVTEARYSDYRQFQTSGRIK
jgi:hypothetical protein